MDLPFHENRDLPDREEFALRYVDWVGSVTSKPSRILDIGMGEGHLVRMLQAEGHMAVGVDVRRIATTGLVEADMVYLSFKAESFDVVTDCWGIEDVEGLQGASKNTVNKIITEVQRVLRPQGFFLTISYITPKGFSECDNYGGSDWKKFRK